ncbi:uncharacterized protein LOC134768525 [Penaeus indicus]|uniref:uncharacterized protein LOC134768525 n=1 Tax=Penaeus indicus TaxID=29960 RepID=UPI00300C376C
MTKKCSHFPVSMLKESCKSQTATLGLKTQNASDWFIVPATRRTKFYMKKGLSLVSELNQMLEGWREKLEDRGLRISRMKTECMKCHFGEEDEQEVDLEIDLEVLRETDIFTYLGSKVQHDGGMEAVITNRIQSGWRNWRKCAGVMTDKRMSMRLKRRICNSVMRHALTYGAETWETVKREEERLNVNEMRMLRWTCGVTRRDRASNRHIRGSLHVTEVAKKEGLEGHRYIGLQYKTTVCNI